MVVRFVASSVLIAFLLAAVGCGSTESDDVVLPPEASLGQEDCCAEAHLEASVSEVAADGPEESVEWEGGEEADASDAWETDGEAAPDSDAAEGAVDAADGPQDVGGETDAGLLCNGNQAYCDRPYNQVSVVCTHNAHSNEEDPGFDIPTPDQKYSFLHQLNDGVRCLMIDTYEYKSAPHLCHAYCELGATAWVPMLKDVGAWLSSHPSEVLTFILESHLSEQATLTALQDGGVFPLVYHHGTSAGSPWPTLRWMIENNKRLVVFTDDTAANGDWHLHWPTYGWETPYNDPTFTCADSRGDPTAYDNQVFILNHYTLCATGGCASNGQKDNLYSFLFPRAVNCWQKDPQYNPWTQIPTFLTVNHYEVPSPGEQSPRADVFDAVEALNAAWPTPPSL